MKQSTALSARMRHALKFIQIGTPLLTMTLALTLCCLSCPVISAGEPVHQLTMQAAEFAYNGQATEQLKGLYCNTLTSGSYQEGRSKLKELVEQEHANPNVVVFSTPLLSTAIMHDDHEFTELLLKRGAQLNRNSLSKAETPKMARLLLKYKADLHACEQQGNVLHDAARNNKPAKMVAFLCNAGVDCNRRNVADSSPVDILFSNINSDPYSDENYRKTLGEKTTIFLWTNADLNSKNAQGKTSLDVLKSEAPELVLHMKARMRVVPQIKSEKEREYQQNLRPLLASHITADPAGLVVAFMGRLMPLPWHKSYFQETEQRVTHELAAATVAACRKTTKRSRSQSPTRTNKK